jgi:hypothetical protein
MNDASTFQFTPNALAEHAHLESDLHVASFLLARGFQLLGLERVGTRYGFKFELDVASGDVTSAIWEYNRGALVPAREFAAAIQQLKSALYAAKFKDGYGNERKYDRMR